MKNDCIRFDWAAKYILRDKADFSIFAEFVSVIIGQPIEIIEFIESESNKKEEKDKMNRVDIKAKDAKGDIIIVEIQQAPQYEFMKRILFGTSKTITDYMKSGQDYKNVKKVYSINVLYFDFGEGDDYLYHGFTQLVGVNTGNTLIITLKEQNGIKIITPKDIFPEYYIIRVRQFEGLGNTPLEQWMRYLKEGEIDSETELPGLRKAMEKLNVINMSPKERKEYEEHLDNMAYQRDAFKGSQIRGEIIGEKRGFEKGIEKGIEQGKNEILQELVKKMRDMGMDENTIQQLIAQ